MAHWFLSSLRHPHKSLGSVSLLLSEAEAAPFVSPREPRRPLDVPIANLENVTLALKYLFDRGDEHEHNLIIFYFCGHGISQGTDTALLFADYGVDIHNPLKSALNLRLFRLGMRRNRASEQCYFIDCCRASTDTLIESQGEAGQRIIGGGLRDTGLPRLHSPIFFATKDGAKAYAIPGEASIFTAALLRALNDFAASDDDGDWRITSTRIQEAVGHLTKSSSQMPVADDVTKIYLHFLETPPRALVYIQSEPSEAFKGATLSYQITGCAPIVVPAEAWNGTEWHLELKAGRYVFNISTGNGTPVITTNNVRPTYSRIVLQAQTHVVGAGSTTLNLRLQSRLVDGTSVGAVVILRKVADEPHGGISRKRIDVVIPANQAGPFQRVSLDAGQWMIEATLPSGEVIVQETTLATGQETNISLLATEQSPHDWLGWQHLVGHIEGLATLESLRTLAVSIGAAAAADQAWLYCADFIGGLIGGEGGGWFRDLARTWWVRTAMASAAALALGPPTEQVLMRLYNLLVPSVGGGPEQHDSEDIRLLAPMVCLCRDPVLDEEAAWTDVFTPDPRRGSDCSAQNSAPRESIWLYEFVTPNDIVGRQCACVDWLGSRYLVSLPLPWASVRDGLAVPIELMVRLHPIERGVHFGVAVRDTDFGPIAAMITTNTLPKAPIAVDWVGPRVFDQGTHPLAAAAAAYIMVSTGLGEERHWQDRLEKLYTSFRQVPDMAILAASSRLRFAKDNAVRGSALGLLLEAFKLGIPYYSAGVCWLLDGLTLVVDDPTLEATVKVDIEKKIELVRGVVMRLDLSQTFTVIRVGTNPK